MHTSFEHRSGQSTETLILADFLRSAGQRYRYHLSPCFDSSSPRCVHALAASGGGNSSLESARAWLRLREFERCRAPLACDHRGPQQELAGAFLVGRDLPQLVEIASTQLRIARFEPVLVRDRLLLHELDRDRSTLKIVEVEQAVRLTAEKNTCELLAES